MTRIGTGGVSIDPPRGFDVRVFRREVVAGPQAARAAAVHREARPHVVLHAASFALPLDPGDFGSGAVDLMADGDLFVVLFEFGQESLGKALFRDAGLPQLRPDDFAPNQLQRTLRGQSGAQRFFTVAGRPFTIYAVLGAHAQRARLVPRLHDVLDRVRIEAPGAPG